jgi:hypothetical protein
MLAWTMDAPGVVSPTVFFLLPPFEITLMARVARHGSFSQAAPVICLMTNGFRDDQASLDR